MASPLPPDPYVALGVSKDADLAQIRTAHRRLALKYHPDRVHGDESDKERASKEFQKAQVAYELLSDASRRSRYDDQVRLAELRKERMMREATRPTVYTTRSTNSGTTVRREMRSDGIHFEERVPTSYFDSGHRYEYDEPIHRSTSRKHEASYEKDRRPSATPKFAEKKEKSSSKISSAFDGVSYNIEARLKAKAEEARNRARSNHVKEQESRDRTKRRERSEKHSDRRTPYVEDGTSDSDSETVTERHVPRSAKSSSRSKPEPEPIPVRSRPSYTRRSDPVEILDDGYDDADKWERHHKTGKEYIAKSSKRPTFSRQNSMDHHYWDPRQAMHESRKSGSDSEKRPSSSRRAPVDESRRPPTIPVQSSAPSNLRPHVEEREPRRSKTSSYPTDRDPRMVPVPGLSRANTAPMPDHRPMRKDTVPTRSSNLRNGETHDSGYSSNSNPQTPEMKGESPPPSRGNPKKSTSSTKYTIVDPDSEGDRPSRVGKAFLDSDEDGRPRRYRSPEPEKRERERDRDRERDRGDRGDREREKDRKEDRNERERGHERPRIDTDVRSRSMKGPAPTSFPRGEFGRFESTSPRASPSTSGKLFMEISDNERDVRPAHRYDPATLKTATYQTPSMSNYPTHRAREAEDDFTPASHFRQQMRGGRRPSVY